LLQRSFVELLHAFIAYIMFGVQEGEQGLQRLVTRNSFGIQTVAVGTLYC
jgi:hypothetical protein